MIEINEDGALNIFNKFRGILKKIDKNILKVTNLDDDIEIRRYTHLSAGNSFSEGRKVKTINYMLIITKGDKQIYFGQMDCKYIESEIKLLESEAVA